MDYDLLYPGAFSMLKVRLKAGESIKAESDAMVAMSNTIDVEGKLDGGLFGGVGRFLSGESFFFQELVARRGAGHVLLAHATPGEIQALELDGSTPYILQKDGFLAGSESLSVSTKMQNLAQGFLSGEGFFVIKISGHGTLFISSYGAIHPIDIPAGREAIIDNYHLVAWPEGMQYTIEKASAGFISSFTSGEGLVCRFRGPGRVLIQTRNPSGFGNWVTQFLPASS
ncbi:MAG: TIGR00266 family protein [Ardenticatenaceae bacterium]